jgi:hypothetical protein
MKKNMGAVDRVVRAVIAVVFAILYSPPSYHQYSSYYTGLPRHYYIV